VLHVCLFILCTSHSEFLVALRFELMKFEVDQNFFVVVSYLAVGRDCFCGRLIFLLFPRRILAFYDTLLTRVAISSFVQWVTKHFNFFSCPLGIIRTLYSYKNSSLLPYSIHPT
jgi:hypothetical protein